MLLSESINEQSEHPLIASAKQAASNYAAMLGKGIPAIFCSDKLYNDDFEVTNKGFAVRGAIPVVVTRFEEVNYVGNEKPNEFGFVTDHSYKYKVYGVDYGPNGFRERTWQTDNVGNLKNLV
jgi:hypothetical protein